MGDLEMMQWIKNLLRPPEYEVTIWYADASSKTFTFRKVSEISNQYISGKDTQGNKFEYSSMEPFNYQIKKIH